jgi:protein SCO1/2
MMDDHLLRRTSTIVACLALIWPSVIPARAQRADEKIPELQGVGVDEHLEAQIPLDLKFRDEMDRVVTLRQYFDGAHPVLLTLNYYRCPMLCTLQLNGLVDGLRSMDWTPGKEFRIVTVSINPRETPELAQLKKRSYFESYGRPEAVAGWAFLTGPEANIKQLAQTVGYNYKYDKDADQYAHPAVAMVCMPDGRISRYLYGITYDPQTLRLSLVEATQGKTASTVDKVLLWCFHYDETKGKYAPAAMKIMQAGGVMTVLILGIVLAVYWRRDARRRRSNSSEAAA